MPLSDYQRFIGREYEPPHGCFRLLEQVFKELYGYDIEGLDEGLDPNDLEARTARLHKELAALCVPVPRGHEREGDVIILRSRPWHIGVIVEPEAMLHSYAGGSACIELYTSMRWRNRVDGIYRYSPP